jgi:hypothetical protein
MVCEELRAERALGQMESMIDGDQGLVARDPGDSAKQFERAMKVEGEASEKPRKQEAGVECRSPHEAGSV